MKFLTFPDNIVKKLYDYCCTSSILETQSPILLIAFLKYKNWHPQMFPEQMPRLTVQFSLVLYRQVGSAWRCHESKQMRAALPYLEKQVGIWHITRCQLYLLLPACPGNILCPPSPVMHPLSSQVLVLAGNNWHNSSFSPFQRGCTEASACPGTRLTPPWVVQECLMYCDSHRLVQGTYSLKTV